MVKICRKKENVFTDSLVQMDDIHIHDLVFCFTKHTSMYHYLCQFCWFISFTVIEWGKAGHACSALLTFWFLDISYIMLLKVYIRSQWKIIAKFMHLTLTPFEKEMQHFQKWININNNFEAYECSNKREKNYFADRQLPFGNQL